jgi:undecaprenyl-diphosphatase
MKWLTYIDNYLFKLINSSGDSDFDFIMILMSNKYIFIPLYIYILFVLFKQYKKKFIWILLSLVILIFLADFGSVHFFKNIFERVRPCNVIPALDGIRLIEGCGTGFSFISAHAANMFSIAFFIGLIKRDLRLFIFLFSLASIVGYSRIYLGVHYPFDIVGGMLWAIIVSLLTYKILSLKFDETIQ